MLLYFTLIISCVKVKLLLRQVGSVMLATDIVPKDHPASSVAGSTHSRTVTSASSVSVVTRCSPASLNLSDTSGGEVNVHYE